MTCPDFFQRAFLTVCRYMYRPTPKSICVQTIKCNNLFNSNAYSDCGWFVLKQVTIQQTTCYACHPVTNTWFVLFSHMSHESGLRFNSEKKSIALFCSSILNITKTCLYNFDPLKSHFHIVKLGFTGVYIIFLISAQNIDCGYSQRRF